MSFSPRNGEVILKIIGTPTMKNVWRPRTFQSPQWGDNSKEIRILVPAEMSAFQSPQWGDNSKVNIVKKELFLGRVSVPAMGR